MKFLSVCVLSVAIVVMGYFISQGLMGFSARQTTSVSVKGLSERVVKADKGVWEISFSVAGSTFDEARSLYMKNVKDIEQFLKTKGFSADEISFETPNNEVNKERDHEGILKEVVYEINSKVIVLSHDVDKIKKASGGVMDLLEKGVSIKAKPWGSNPRYLLSDFDKLRPDMLIEALRSAKIMAQKFAEDGGVKVGRILSADQGGFSIRSNISESEPESGAIYKKVRVVSRFTYALDG